MAKFEVVQAYTDKHTGRVCYQGEVLEEPQERAQELAEAGFVRLLDEVVENKPKKRTRKKEA